VQGDRRSRIEPTHPVRSPHQENKNQIPKDTESHQLIQKELKEIDYKAVDFMVMVSFTQNHSSQKHYGLWSTVIENKTRVN
jgi:hypothetical protein